jgi:hypothetical protein
MGQLRINFKMKLLNFSRKRFDLDQYLHLRVDKTAMQMRRYCCLDQATSSLDAESDAGANRPGRADATGPRR